MLLLFLSRELLFGQVGFHIFGVARQFSRNVNQNRGKCCPFFFCLFESLLGQFDLPSWVTRAIFPSSFSKKLVRQVDYPKYLDQSRGKCLFFFQISSWAICFSIFG